MIVDAAQWFSLDTDAAASVARSIAERSGSELTEVRPYEYAGRRGPVALFAVGDEQFAFVPGGAVTVGFDSGGFEPTPEQEASFADTAEEYGIEGDIRQFTGSVTSPARTVVVPPLLVAVEAVEAGLVAVPPDHPEVVRRVEKTRSLPGPGLPSTPRQIEWSGAARAILRPDWTVEAAWLLGEPQPDLFALRFSAGIRRSVRLPCTPARPTVRLKLSVKPLWHRPRGRHTIPAHPPGRDPRRSRQRPAAPPRPGGCWSWWR